MKKLLFILVCLSTLLMGCEKPQEPIPPTEIDSLILCDITPVVSKVISMQNRVKGIDSTIIEDIKFGGICIGFGYDEGIDGNYIGRFIYRPNETYKVYLKRDVPYRIICTIIDTIGLGSNATDTLISVGCRKFIPYDSTNIKDNWEQVEFSTYYEDQFDEMYSSSYPNGLSYHMERRYYVDTMFTTSENNTNINLSLQQCMFGIRPIITGWSHEGYGNSDEYVHIDFVNGTSNEIDRYYQSLPQFDKTYNSTNYIYTMMSDNNIVKFKIGFHKADGQWFYKYTDEIKFSRMDCIVLNIDLESIGRPNQVGVKLENKPLNFQPPILIK